MKTVNGWLLPLNLGRYGTDYNTRAFVAFVGLGALWAEDAVYPSAFVDGDGKPLDGARAYLLHFEKDGLFPSHGEIWSISAYRGLRAQPHRTLRDHLRNPPALQRRRFT